MTIQIAIRIPDGVAEGLDRLVSDGHYPNRTAAVRAAVEDLIESRTRQSVDQAIIDGYTRIPPTKEEQHWADVAGRDMLTEDPW